MVGGHSEMKPWCGSSEPRGGQSPNVPSVGGCRLISWEITMYSFLDIRV